MVCYVCQENRPDSQTAYMDYGLEPEPTTGYVFFEGNDFATEINFSLFLLVVCYSCLGFSSRGDSLIHCWQEHKFRRTLFGGLAQNEGIELLLKYSYETGWRF